MATATKTTIKEGTASKRTPADVLAGVIEKFQNGEIGPVIARARNPRRICPSASWSLLNLLTIIAAGTEDARGFQQWNKVGRRVKKGSKAIYILAPMVHKSKDKDGKEVLGEDGKPKSFISGFRSVPVFRFEDTEGDPLPQGEALPELPPFPLLEVAEAAGVEVKNTFAKGGALGWYSPGSNAITMASPEAMVFFHELGHAIHHKVCPEKVGKNYDYDLGEVVAETSAEAMAVMIGYQDFSQFSGSSWRYIQRYGEKHGEETPVKAIMKVVKEIEKVLDFVDQYRK